MTLRAVFERDCYVLTLNGDLQAYYYDDTDSNSNTPDEKVVVLTGAAIPGDKSVFVEPRSGFSVNSWTNVDCTDQAYNFTITADTVITADTYYNGYDVVLTTTQAANGNSAVVISKDISESITGGTEIVFEAKPYYGTRLAGWKVNGADYLTASTDTLTLSPDGRKLTIKAIGSNYNIEAIFVNNEAYTLTLTKAAYGAMTVTVNNPAYGTVDNPTYTYDNAAVTTELTVYKGDVVNLDTTTAYGFRVIYWKEDSATTQTEAATWTISNIQANKSIAVDFSSIGFYAVTYATEGSGSFSSTKIDGVSFESGNQSMGAGTTISFAANPAIGYMLDHWTTNGTTVLNSYGEPLVDKDYSFVLSRNTDLKAIFSDLVTHAITLSGDNATLKVTEVLPTDYATGNANDGYTSVRDGAAIILVVTPADDYRIESVSAEGAAGIELDRVTKNEDGTWICTINSLKENITFAASTVQLYDTILSEFQGGTASIEPSIAAAGDTVNITASAASDYQFSQWLVVDGAGNAIIVGAANEASTTFTMPAGDVTVTPIFAPRSIGGGGGGGGGFTVPVAAPEKNPVDMAVKAGKQNTAGQLVATVEVKAANNAGQFEQNIPRGFFNDDDKILEIVTPEGTVTLPDDMFDELPDGDIKLSIAQVDIQSLNLPENVIEQIGDKPIIDINIAIGGQKTQWKNENKEITLSIPYTLTAAEKAEPHKVIAVYIDDNGNVTPLTVSNYDSVKGAIVFNTNHTSYYSVQYVDKNFDDLDSCIWAEESIEALAARGIINGISDQEFAPRANLTRADFVVLITKLFGLKHEASVNFADVNAGTYYYNAVGAAKELGIISGAGDNKFNPLESISRQDMMVIITRALEITRQTDKLTTNNGRKISDFKDNQDVSSYAKDAVEYLITKGIVSGDGDYINPTNSTRRAEVATLLHKILEQLK